MQTGATALKTIAGKPPATPTAQGAATASAFAHLLGSAATPKAAPTPAAEKRPARAEATAPATEPVARKATPKAAAPVTEPHAAAVAADIPSAAVPDTLAALRTAEHATPESERHPDARDDGLSRAVALPVPALEPRSETGVSHGHPASGSPAAKAATTPASTDGGTREAPRTTPARTAATAAGTATAATAAVATPIASPKSPAEAIISPGAEATLPRPASSAGAGPAETRGIVLTEAAGKSHKVGAAEGTAPPVATTEAAAAATTPSRTVPTAARGSAADLLAAAMPRGTAAATATGSVAATAPATATTPAAATAIAHAKPTTHGAARSGSAASDASPADPVPATAPRMASAPSPTATRPAVDTDGKARRTEREPAAAASGREPSPPARRFENVAVTPASLPASSGTADATSLAGRLRSVASDAAAVLAPKGSETPAAGSGADRTESATAGTAPVTEPPKPRAERIAAAKRDGHEPALKAPKSPETSEMRTPPAQPAETGAKSAAKDDGAKPIETVLVAPSSAPDAEPIVSAAPERIVESRVALTREATGHAAATVPTVALRVHSKDGTTRAIEIRLDPPGMGRVDVRLETGSDGKLSAVLQTDTSQAFELLKRESGALEAALREAGVQLGEDGLSFTLNDQGSGQAFARDSGYSGAFRRQEDSINDMTTAAAQPTAWRDGVVDIQV